MFVYVANWGTRRLLVKLPRGAVDPKELERYVAEPALTMEVGEEHVLLELLRDDEEGAGWVEDREARGWMPSLAPLRAELLRGETTPLYLAWLRGATTGFAEPEEATEPPAPAGLRELSGPCRALCDFLALDPSLVAAAAAPSELAPKALRAWLAQVPAAEKDEWLVRLATGKPPDVGAEIARRFRQAHAPPGARGSRPKPRTAADLLARADALRAERKAREARAKPAARKKLRSGR
jgi:hypothetical protein